MKACVISLGCPKNLCDSEILMGQLVSAGYELTNKEREADLFVVNTCAFLKAARDESLQTIRSLRKYRKKIYVAGCLPKYSPSTSGRGGTKGGEGYINSIGLHPYSAPRIKATPPWTAYVKIAEGCNNRCSYCLIPKIRGKLKLRSVADILSEVKMLAKRGVKEVIFIAQDTTAHPQLSEILRRSANIRGLRWIRLMYAHPAHLTEKVIKTIKTEPKIVKYLDLPLQHINDRILREMDRHISRVQILDLISKIRREIPKIAIRTSFIVGFPGETDAEFKELLDFIKEVRFEKLGAFIFSREKGTPAAKKRGQVPEKVKRFRLHRLLPLQKRIAKELNLKLIGKKLEVLYEGRGRGRTRYDAPLIDGSVKMSGKYRPGELVKVKITGAGAYDLVT
ncbi:MiaB/RimO family radical SAM methylthiotransferase [Candidatus Saganbacteria bacterium]|nr:MiaB/RimO family radical SAM methylthiotransferase [Candidatus Saganbacteria bacterium]